MLKKVLLLSTLLTNLTYSSNLPTLQSAQDKMKQEEQQKGNVLVVPNHNSSVILINPITGDSFELQGIKGLNADVLDKFLYIASPNMPIEQLKELKYQRARGNKSFLPTEMRPALNELVQQTETVINNNTPMQAVSQTNVNTTSNNSNNTPPTSNNNMQVDIRLDPDSHIQDRPFPNNNRNTENQLDKNQENEISNNRNTLRPTNDHDRNVSNRSNYRNTTEDMNNSRDTANVSHSNDERGINRNQNNPIDITNTNQSTRLSTNAQPNDERKFNSNPNNPMDNSNTSQSTRLSTNAQPNDERKFNSNPNNPMDNSNTSQSTRLSTNEQPNNERKFSSNRNNPIDNSSNLSPSKNTVLNVDKPTHNYPNDVRDQNNSNNLPQTRLNINEPPNMPRNLDINYKTQANSNDRSISDNDMSINFNRTSHEPSKMDNNNPRTDLIDRTVVNNRNDIYNNKTRLNELTPNRTDQNCCRLDLISINNDFYKLSPLERQSSSQQTMLPNAALPSQDDRQYANNISVPLEPPTENYNSNPRNFEYTKVENAPTNSVLVNNFPERRDYNEYRNLKDTEYSNQSRNSPTVNNYSQSENFSHPQHTNYVPTNTIPPGEVQQISHPTIEYNSVPHHTVEYNPDSQLVYKKKINNTKLPI